MKSDGWPNPSMITCFDLEGLDLSVLKFLKTRFLSIDINFYATFPQLCFPDTSASSFVNVTSVVDLSALFVWPRLPDCKRRHCLGLLVSRVVVMSACAGASTSVACSLCEAGKYGTGSGWNL
jgi:hypothetical protein